MSTSSIRMRRDQHRTWIACWVFGCVAAGTIAAGADPSDSAFATALAKMSQFKNEMCTCRDTACASRVSEDMAKWSQEQAKNEKSPPKISEDESKRATALAEAMGKCMQRAMASTDSRGPQSAEQNALALMTEFKSKMCACKDTACALAVSDDMTELDAVLARLAPADRSDSGMKKLNDLAEEGGKCTRRALATPYTSSQAIRG